MRTRGRGLARQMILFALVVILASGLAIGVISLRGVYSLVLSEDESRLNTYRQLLVDEVSSHLALISHLIEPVGRIDELATVPGEPLSEALARAVLANAEYVDALAVVDASGTVLAASAPGAFPASLSGSALFAGVPQERRPTFAWGRGSRPGDPPVVWVFRKLEAGSGDVRVVVGRVRVGFVERLLDEVASGSANSAALLVARGGEIVIAGSGGVPVGPADLEFGGTTAAGKHTGPASADTAAEGRMVGFYADITTGSELGWRVVVLESESETMARARQALLPAVLATVLVAGLATGVSLLYARRLVAPLLEFERRARDIAAGGYVRPMVVDRSDEIGKLAEAFNQITVRLNSLQDMAQLLASASEPEEVYDAVLSAIGHLLGTSDAAVLLADDQLESLVLVRGRGLREPGLRFSVPFSAPSPLTEAFHGGAETPFEGRSAQGAMSVFGLFDAPPDRSGIAVPLSIGDQVLGVVVALAPGHRPMTRAQIETVRAFCAQAAVAVRTSRLFETEHTSRREAEALREAAELIVGTRDLDRALDEVALVAARLLDMPVSAVAIRDREEFGLAASSAPSEESRLLELWTANIDAGDLASPHPVVAGGVGDAAAQSTLLVPLVRDGEVKGVFALTSEPGSPDPGEREIALAGTLGKEVSLALENAGLLQEARARAANMETVFRISQAVSSSLQVNVVLNRVLDVVQKIFSADAVSLMAYDAERKTIDTSMARGVSNREMLYLRVSPGEDIPGGVFDSRAPRMYGDLGIVDTPLARLATAQGLRSLVAVPLLARGRSTGVLTAYSRGTDAFSSEDMELLLTFASQAALAIDTASLYGREHRLASTLQASILPESLPALPGLESGSFYLPAGLDAEIGGDYYDLFPLRDGTVVLAIADVCGKGVKAATKTSMIKHSLRGLVAAGAGPGQALEELNRLVAASGDPSDIVTAWIGFLDRERRVLRYADGGHPPALLFRPSSREFTRLDPTGPLLGAIENAPYGERLVPVQPDDVILLYTDGVTEARFGAKFFGEGRIRRVMRRSGSAVAVVDRLLAAVRTFSAGAMRDDAAVLAVKLRAPAGSIVGLGLRTSPAGVDCTSNDHVDPQGRASDPMKT